MSLATLLELRARKGEFRLVGFNRIIDHMYLVNDFKYLEHAELRADFEANEFKRMKQQSSYTVYDDKGNVVYQAHS